MTTKTCTRCKQTKPLTAFSKDKYSLDGCKGQCKLCCNSATKHWRKNNLDYRKQYKRDYAKREPEKCRKSAMKCNLKHKYGITLTEYNAMLKAQHGVCAICRRPGGKQRLGVDHNHSTGKIRALLCSTCNTALGSIDERTDLLYCMIDYLETYGAANE